MSDHATDEQFLHRALGLARQGIGLASPNPHVGAVIVGPNGNIVGNGTYTYAQRKHAEIIAIEQAGSNARGGTLYINLEPHAHQGRTPPCTDALISAGIRRVVASMPDPNPKVSGRGFQQLRTAGIQVEVGQFEIEARRLNEAFARYIRHGVPLVTLKAAMTLDGKIAPRQSTVSSRESGTPAGGSVTREWITGELARANVQEQRHQSDAILVGVGTILADDPLLTDRSGHRRRRSLLRVVLDSHLRTPINSRLIKSVTAGIEAESDVLIFYCEAEENKKGDLQARGIRVERIPSSPDHGVDLQAALRRLGELEITSLMIEGGSSINGSALYADVVDKVFLYYAPLIFGSESVPFASGAGLAGALPRLTSVQLHRFAEDIAIEGYLRDPYGV
jgi:diaminohydroxyphosphoribosylaminopyrimidine deaminase / 5-amino-6-(5-phosphoribosylamino)uracil reductase